MTKADLLLKFPGSTINTVRNSDGETITLKLANGYTFWFLLKTSDLEIDRERSIAIAYQRLAEQARPASLLIFPRNPHLGP